MQYFLTIIFTAMFLCPLLEAKTQPDDKQDPPKAQSLSTTSTTITKVVGESGKKLSVVNLHLIGKPSWSDLKVEAHGNFLQVKLPNTMVPDPGKFFDIESPYFKKIVMLQADQNTAIVRIFTKGDTTKVAKATDLDIFNDRLVLTADHKTLEKMLSSDVQNQTMIDVATTSPSQSKPISSSADMNGYSGPPETKQELIDSKLKIAAIFSLAMIVLLLIPLTMRRLSKNRRFFDINTSTTPMKILNTLSLAPKQKISLIQVGHERLLLSVTSEGVSLLSHISPENPGERNQFASRSINSQKKLETKPNHLTDYQNTLTTDSSASFKQQKNRAVAKDLDDKTLRTRKHSSSDSIDRRVLEKSAKPKQHSIEYAVDDQGIHRNERKPSERTSRPEKPEKSTEKAIDDVTQLIREKLRSLPKI